jgi:rRNA maturation protein Nop10
MDNHYGEGLKVGKNIFFVMSGDCPLHGDKTKIERPDCFDFDDSEPQEHKKRRKGAKKCS